MEDPESGGENAQETPDAPEAAEGEGEEETHGEEQSPDPEKDDSYQEWGGKPEDAKPLDEEDEPQYDDVLDLDSDPDEELDDDDLPEDEEPPEEEDEEKEERMRELEEEIADLGAQIRGLLHQLLSNKQEHCEIGDLNISGKEVDIKLCDELIVNIHLHITTIRPGKKEEPPDDGEQGEETGGGVTGS